MLVWRLATEPSRYLIQRQSFRCLGGTDKQKRRNNRTLQMRRVAGMEPAIGWTGQVRLNDDHYAR